ncbi:ABC transporter ATP-binding protein [Gramella sp. GC03-9]|uniref:ABC transporter ATP-binding protein n=1 Tax=Christiangramia oceanisediminis TaxID=2920386 RepID=A0A9X2R8V6_9FLAO|nr:ABC transporter ATP-binding protein [Gramella oceanisediminis]MCP9200498.1 ABC transporter ATP-binding protein [Gramella oceanisediminis]
MEDLKNKSHLRRAESDRGFQPLIKLEDLSFSYTRDSFYLKIPELLIGRSEKLGITGPSGCGKTTLLNLISGIIKPNSGKIFTGDIELTSLGNQDIKDLRLVKMGLIFQQFELLEYLSVLDNILLPFRINPILELQSETKERASSLAISMGLGDKLKRYPANLSQGERQRVSVARALITKPELLICDEPTANLDPVNRDRILDIIDSYCDKTNTALVMVTHDREILGRFDRVLDILEFSNFKDNRGHE